MSSRLTHRRLSFILLALISCGENSHSTSQLEGHFESSSMQEFTELAGKQRATAEWEPSRGVVISQLLLTRYNKTDMAKAILDSGVDKLWVIAPKSSKEQISSMIFRDLRNALGSATRKVEIIPQQKSGDVTVWARDWAPQGSKTSSGDLRLLDFNYFPEREADDFTSQSMERFLNFDRISVPVYNEGGNFMTTTHGHCLMTTRVNDANEEKEIVSDMVLKASEIQDYYKSAAGCRDVTIFPRMPYEGTGHIDMWAKLLDDDTVLVGEVRPDALALYANENSRGKAREIAAYLDERTEDLEDQGFHVVRIPMPGPIFDGNLVFRSYTNSLIVNQSVLVPRYVKPAEDTIATFQRKYFDQDRLGSYEKEVRTAYEKYGYRIVFIDSDELIYNGGAVHCTTMQIPR